MGDHLLGDAELPQREAARLAERRQRRREHQRPLRQRVDQAFVDAEGEAGGMGGGGQLVEQLVHPLGTGVGEVERATVEVGLVGDVLECRRDPVDRDDVRVTEVESDQWHPLRQQVAHPLDRLEEVVGAVDLVHLARLGVPDDDSRPVHTPGDVGLLADDPLGLELRAVIRRGQPLALGEHVLVEQPLELARDRDRGDVMEVLDVQRSRQFDRVCGASDVDRRIALGRGGHVVDGRQVEEVGDLAPQLGDLFLLDAQERSAQITEDRLDALRHGRSRDHAPALDQIVQTRLGALPHEHVDLALTLFQQPLDQTTADESGCSRHEVGHAQSLSRIGRR